VIALLVIGATSPATLRPLVERFGRPGFRCYLHVDASVQLDDYLESVGPGAEDITVLTNRSIVYWGGWSMVQATFGLMRAALADPAVDVLTLVSDDTAPLLSPDELAARLHAQPVRITRYSVEGGDVRDRYEQLFFLDSGFTSARARPLGERVIDPTILRQVLADLEELATLGKAPVDLHTGPQWWSLDRATAEHVLSRVERDRALELSFRYSAIPDELLVQTLAAEMHGTNRNLLPDSSPMLFDFSRAVRPHVFETVEDVAGFRRSTGQHDKLFVRKVGLALAQRLAQGGLQA